MSHFNHISKECGELNQNYTVNFIYCTAYQIFIRDDTLAKSVGKIQRMQQITEQLWISLSNKLQRAESVLGS
jgi:hypothetical protein